MDLMALLRYLFDHNQQVIGGLMVIILATAALLMMRMVSQEKPAGAGAKGGPSDLDIGTIESAFKRVLAAQGIAPLTKADAGTPASAPAASGDDQAKIQELAREIDRLTAELSAKAAAPSEATGFGGTKEASTSAGAKPGAVDAATLEILNAKIAELEGKLTEYEIIEDDIADLSRFKEENAELRSQLDALKANVPSTGAPPAPGAAAATGAPTPTPAAAAPSATAPAASGPPPATEEELAADPLADVHLEVAGLTKDSLPKEPVAKAPGKTVEKPASELGVDEIAMRESGSAVEIEIGPSADAVAPSSEIISAVAAASLGDGSSVLDDSLDTEKMLSEVSSLANEPGTDDAGLEESLDTDKLLAEMGSMSPEAAPVAATSAAAAAPEATPVSAPSPATAPAPVAAAAAAAAPAAPPATASDGATLEDDLLAEFKESNDGGQG